MRPKELIYSPLADQDLIGIFLHIAADDVAAAPSFIRDLVRKMECIAISGFPGVPRDELSPGLKVLPYRRRPIYFRTTDTTVRILRILHSHQNTSPDDFTESTA